MYSVEQFQDGTREAILSVEGLVFRSRTPGNLDILYPTRPVPNMNVWIFFASDADPGEAAWGFWDEHERLATADTPEILIQKVRMVLVGRMLGLVATYNSLFRLDVPEGRAKLSL